MTTEGAGELDEQPKSEEVEEVEADESVEELMKTKRLRKQSLPHQLPSPSWDTTFFSLDTILQEAQERTKRYVQKGVIVVICAQSEQFDCRKTSLSRAEASGGERQAGS